MSRASASAVDPRAVSASTSRALLEADMGVEQGARDVQVCRRLFEDLKDNEEAIRLAIVRELTAFMASADGARLLSDRSTVDSHWEVANTLIVLGQSKVCSAMGCCYDPT